MKSQSALFRSDFGTARGVAQATAAAVMLALASAGWAQSGAEHTQIAAAPKAAPAKKAADKGAAPPRTEVRAPMPVCTGEMPAPVAVSVINGKSTLVKFPNTIALRTLADDSIAQARLLSPQTLYILGTRIGSTNMILQDVGGRCTILDVTVGMDPEALRTKLLQLMPDERGIQVSAAADSLVLSGVVSDATKVDQVLSLAGAYVRQEQSAASAGSPMAVLGGAAGGTRQNVRVINMLSVAAPQQVLLEVKVAEVAKTLADKLGASFAAQGSDRSWSYGISSNLPSGGGGLIELIKRSNLAINVDAQKDNGLVKILAEPNVMAVSGQEGSFLAGGKVYIPVPQTSGIGGAATITLEEKEFGVGLKFTPTVLAGGLINLRVSPEVSEFSREGLAVTAPGISGGQIVPLITTRRASTTVQLYDGQSFVIGGLIKNNVTTNIKAFPVLGEIPILGALFRSTDFQTDRSEVLFVVTPRLVKPLTGPVALPTDGYVEPSRSELFLEGRMEGKEAPKPAQPEAPKAEGPSGFVVK